MTLGRHDELAAAFDAAGDVAESFRDPVTGEYRQETMIINMGPQHPSTHGVLRLLLELDGETVIRCKPVIGYLHTGIEKNTEYRTWVQGVTFVTRADYVAQFSNELAYCLGVERLLDVEVPERARLIRVLVCELNRITSHLVGLATTGLEMGASSVMLYGLRERELIMEIFEALTGLRMNNAYIRPGGVVMDLHEEAPRRLREVLDVLPGRIDEYETLLNDNPIWRERNEGVAVLSAERCLELGITGPVLRASGVERDLRKDMPYAGYELFDFDVPTRTEGDAYARYRVRIDEMRESLRIVEQALAMILRTPGPVMVEDPKIGWQARLSVGPDGIGNDPEYLAHIMEGSMEALIHHFKMVTQGIAVPAGEVYSMVEAPRGELGLYIVSDGGHRPYRVKIRDPSFVNLQALPDVIEGYLVADIIAAVSSIDPVMGGVDR